jgi:hypothetical protein
LRTTLRQKTRPIRVKTAPIQSLPNTSSWMSCSSSSSSFGRRECYSIEIIGDLSIGRVQSKPMSNWPAGLTRPSAKTQQVSLSGLCRRFHHRTVKKQNNNKSVRICSRVTHLLGAGGARGAPRRNRYIVEHGLNFAHHRQVHLAAPTGHRYRTWGVCVPRGLISVCARNE